MTLGPFIDPGTASAEIDLAAFRANVSTIKAHVEPAALMVVVKADGYGHGAVDVAGAALGAAAGLVPAMFPFMLVAGMTERSEFPLWLLGFGIVGATTLVSVVLAVSLARVSRSMTRGKSPASA